MRPAIPVKAALLHKWVSRGLFLGAPLEDNCAGRKILQRILTK